MDVFLIKAKQNTTDVIQGLKMKSEAFTLIKYMQVDIKPEKKRDKIFIQPLFFSYLTDQFSMPVFPY